MLPVAFALATGAAQAALIFDFTLTDGTLDGLSATGRILGLNDNSTGAATQVIIDTLPAGFPFAAAGPLPIDATALPIHAIGYANSFTVLAGIITAADFGSASIVNISIPAAFSFSLKDTLGPPPIHEGFIHYSNPLTNFSGPVSYTLESSPVPEPASITAWLAMTALAVGGFHLARRRRRASGSSPAG